MNACKYFLKNYQNVSSNSDSWIQRMHSSSSNFDKKFVFGNTFDFGNFDKCITTKVDDLNIVGKHCMIKFQSENVIPVNPSLSPRNFKWKNVDVSFGGAICLPSDCDNHAIKSLTDYLFNKTDLSLSTDYNQEEFCQVTKQTNFELGDYLTISLILLYIIILLIITWKTKNRQSNSSLLKSFSLLESFKSLIERDSESLNYIKPIRSILYIGLVFYHSIFVRVTFPSKNSEKVLEFEASPYSKTIATFPFGLTGFFVISSVLTTKKILRLLDENGLNFLKMTIERYTRTVIVIAVVIFFSIFINGLELFQAPYYFPDQQSKECKEYWWTTLLMIQNYYHSTTGRMCLPQCWFLSANFHFFLLTPLVVYPIWKWKHSVWLIIPALLILNHIFILRFVLENEDFLRNLSFFAITNPKFGKYYLQTHYLASAWIIGMIVGIIFHKYNQFKMNLITKFCLLNYIAFMFFKLFAWNFIFGQPEFNVFLYTIDRLLISLLAGSTLFLLNYSSNELNELIKLKSNIINLLWNVIDRLGFSLYLVHFSVINAIVVVQKQPLTLNLFFIILTAICDLVVSLFCALLLYLFIETPFRKLIKKILDKQFLYCNVSQQVTDVSRA